MSPNRRANLWELVKVNLYPLGLEFVSGASMTFVVPSLMSSGLGGNVVGMVVASGPMLAMVMGPKVGALSDSFSHSNPTQGKRTPFIFGLTALILLSLLVIPYSNWIAHFLPERYSGLIQLGLLFLGIIFMDGGIAVAFTPFEALLDDMYEGCGVQRAFGIKTLMVSLGGSLAYLLCSIDLNTFAFSTLLGGADRLLFLILFFCFFLTFIGTLRGVKNSSFTEIEGRINWTVLSPLHMYSYMFKIPLLVFKIPAAIRAIFASMFELVGSLLSMPKVFTRLWMAHFCCWMGLMSLIIYYTEYFGEVIYNGDPAAEKGTPERISYEEGLRMGSLGLFLQNVVGIVTAFFADDIIFKLGRRKTFLYASLTFALATGTIFVSRSVILVLLATGITGFLLTAIQVLPYSLLSQYHKDTLNLGGDETDKFSQGLCEAYALLDSAYFLSHLVPIFIVSLLIELTHSPLSYAACSAVFGGLGVLAATQVVYDRADYAHTVSRSPLLKS